MTDPWQVRIGLIAFAIAVCAACAPVTADRSAGVSLFAQALPFCEMVRNRPTYFEREILVRAFLVSNDHGSEIFDDTGNCREGMSLRNGLQDDKRAASIVSAELTREHYPEVVLRGRLQRRHSMLPCSDDSCFEYFFGDVQIVAARPGHPFHDLSKPYVEER